MRKLLDKGGTLPATPAVAAPAAAAPAAAPAAGVKGAQATPAVAWCFQESASRRHSWPARKPAPPPPTAGEVAVVRAAFDMDTLRKCCLADAEALMGAPGFDTTAAADGRPHAFHAGNGPPVLGVAHCDIVAGLPKVFAADAGNGYVFSPGLDDRLGVYTLVHLLPRLGVDTDVLLTTDEERGRSTARDFAPSREYNWLYSFDRRGTGAVCYDYSEMEDVIGKHLTVVTGTYSDIRDLAHLGVCGVNIGTAYYDEHSKGCHAVLEEYFEQVAAFVGFWRSRSGVRTPHTPAPPRVTTGYSGYDASWRSWPGDNTGYRYGTVLSDAERRADGVDSVVAYVNHQDLVEVGCPYCWETVWVGDPDTQEDTDRLDATETCPHCGQGLDKETRDTLQEIAYDTAWELS